MRQTKFIDTVVATEALGLESMADIAGSMGQNTAVTALGRFSAESDAKCFAIMGRFAKPMLESAHADDEMKKKDYWTNQSLTIEQASREIVRDANKFSILPKDVQKMLKPLSKNKVALESAMAKIDNRHSAKYAALKFKLDQCKTAMESMLFNHFANLQNRKTANGMFGGGYAGLESYSHQNAIFYPKLEALTQWVNTSAAIYPKLSKIKQLLNEITSVPVHTQEIEVIFYDENGHEVRRVRREKLYNTMEPIVPEAYNTFTRKLTLKKADFGKDIFFRTTLLDGMTAPFITPNELVRSDFYVTNVVLEDETELGKVLDPKAGLMEGETFNEMDWKGKMVKLIPNPEEPNKYYYVTGMFDGSEQSLVFAQASKSDPSMEDIAYIEMEFKIHDIYMTQKANTDFRIVERRGFIQAGAIGRLDIPLSQTELDMLDARLQGNFLNKITNLASEYITHDKDYKWYKGYKEMKAKVQEAYRIDKTFTLYGEQSIDMNIPGQVNKVEALNLYLGSAFEVLKEKLNVSANTQTDVQLNLFSHTLHLPVLRQVLTHVTGTVDEEANGKFLGVAQDARVHVITVGNDQSAPVSSIVVGTDKMDLMVKVDEGVAPQDIEYPFEIIPSYKETNLETTLFVETPTRVISDNAVRSNRRPFIPAMFMEYSSDFRVLRGAAATLKVKGNHIRTVY